MHRLHGFPGSFGMLKQAVAEPLVDIGEPVAHALVQGSFLLLEPGTKLVVRLLQSLSQLAPVK